MLYLEPLEEGAGVADDAALQPRRLAGHQRHVGLERTDEFGSSRCSIVCWHFFKQNRNQLVAGFGASSGPQAMEQCPAYRSIFKSCFVDPSLDTSQELQSKLFCDDRSRGYCLNDAESSCLWERWSSFPDRAKD